MSTQTNIETENLSLITIYCPQQRFQLLQKAQIIFIINFVHSLLLCRRTENLYKKNSNSTKITRSPIIDIKPSIILCAQWQSRLFLLWPVLSCDVTWLFQMILWYDTVSCVLVIFCVSQSTICVQSASSCYCLLNIKYCYVDTSHCLLK